MLLFPANKSGIPLYVVAARMVRELPTRNETLGNVVKANVWTGERVVHWLEAACGVPFSRAIILGTLSLSCLYFDYFPLTNKASKLGYVFK